MVANSRRGRPPAVESPASRDQIFTAALREFASKGFDGASVAAINRELGVSHNLIHQRFGAKEALWYATVDWVFADMATQLAAEQDLVGLSPLEQLRFTLIRFIELHAERPDILRLVTVEGAADSPRLAYLYEHHMEPLYDHITQPLKQLADPRLLSRADLRSMHFLIAHGATAPFSLLPLSSRFPGGDPGSKKAIRRHAEFVSDVVIAGLQSRGL